MAERVVLDTNVWISGLLWRGNPHRCLLLARSGVVRPVYCQAMLEELLEKLRSSFNFPEEDLQIVKNEFVETGERVEIGGGLRVVPEDQDDDKFIECALAGSATIIVSGDKHLLRVRAYEGIRMMSPTEFIQSISGDSR